MENPGIGWIAALIIGGIAGWLAEQFMKSDMGLLMNIVLGVVGAAIASAIFSFFGIVLGGWIGYLIAGSERYGAAQRETVSGFPSLLAAFGSRQLTHIREFGAQESDANAPFAQPSLLPGQALSKGP